MNVPILDHIPVATVTFLTGVVLLVIAYCNGTMSINDAFENLLFLGGGSGTIGYVRNQAGKAVKVPVKPPAK